MGTVIRIILMRYLWREVKVKFWYDVFVCCPKRIEFRLECVSIAHEGYCRPEQLASVGDPPNCRASPPPGIFLVTSPGWLFLERDFLVCLGSSNYSGFCPPLMPGERDMVSWLLRGNASCSTTGPPARAFCHHTCWAYRWLLLASRAWAGHILKKLP